MKLHLSALFFFATSFCCSVIYAQRYDSLLNVLDSRYPQEKIYLHFDRALYSPGETIWFKAYLFTGSYPSPLSKTVYAELVDEQGKVLQRKSAPIIMSGAAAAFDLPADLKGSMVYVRAYTRWMLNFDTSFLFVKTIPLTNKSRPVQAVQQSPTAFLQFFPEGGSLVSGLSSRVAFKAIDQRGLPVAVKGEVVSSSGQRIPFSSRHDGMGTFMLQPGPGEQYKAHWKDQSGRAQETALPQSLGTGVVLKVDNSGEKIDFTILKSPDASIRAVYVVAQMHQQLLYRARATLSNRSSASGSIPLLNAPAGVVQITVFTEDEKPLAERLVFVNQDNYYFITDLNSPSKNLTKRARNVIQIDVPDTIACNLSISITDATLNPAGRGELDIFSHVLLSSDIRGYVHEPAYYFSGTDSALMNLDLVMLTHGWRRFKWEEVLAGRWPEIKHEPENYLAIKGKVSGLNKSSLVQKDIMFLLETKNAGKQFMTVGVQPDGTFEINDALFFDTAQLHYQFNNDKDKLLTTRGVFEFRNTLFNEALKIKPDVTLIAPPPKTDSSLAARNATVTGRRLAQENASRKVQTLATVEVTARQKSKEEKLNEEYASGMYSGNGQIFAVEDDKFAQSALSIFTYLQGKVAGLQITGGSSPTLSWRGGSPGLYLNEMQVDVGMLQGIPISEVAMIKVFSPPFLGSFGGSSGGIAVYTKKGRAAEQDAKGLERATVTGYSLMKEFYSPDYSKVEQSASEQGDYRTTLYWNPLIFTDKQNRRILLPFYNNDITGRIRVVVEGCNVDGKLTRMEKIFE